LAEVAHFREPQLHALKSHFADPPARSKPHAASLLHLVRYKLHSETSAVRNEVTMAGGLESIFLANRPALLRYVRARFRGDGEPEDIVQDVWLKLSSRETGPIAEPLAYLYRMTENLVLDRRRSAIRRVNREREWTSGQIDGTFDSPIDSQPNPERILLARDHLRRVNAALDALPERTAFTFRAVRIDGTPQKDIALAMGISLSAVEKHLQRAYRAVIEVQNKLSVEKNPPERLGLEGHNHVG
jgi:RNA polymerase sigma factor (sigma-70 family)